MIFFPSTIKSNIRYGYQPLFFEEEFRLTDSGILEHHPFTPRPLVVDGPPYSSRIDPTEPNRREGACYTLPEDSTVVVSNKLYVFRSIAVSGFFPVVNCLGHPIISGWPSKIPPRKKKKNFQPGIGQKGNTKVGENHPRGRRFN